MLMLVAKPPRNASRPTKPVLCEAWGSSAAAPTSDLILILFGCVNAVTTME